MAASLKGIDPDLKHYLKINKLPEVYEALLSGLSIMCPDDPLDFLIRQLRYLDENGTDDMQWDMFIAEHMRPKQKLLLESNLDAIFNFDENSQFPGSRRRRQKYGNPKYEPTPEMYERAYSHYNGRLKKMCFSAWMQFHMWRLQMRFLMQIKMHQAAMHYTQRIMKVHLNNWVQWLRFRKGRQAVAYNKVQHVYHVAVCRVIFKAWHDVTMDAKRTREYFERLERGENMEDDDAFGKGSGDARDDISMLPKKVAIKIFSHIDICDLARCAQVCRSWKVITQSSSLWSRLDLTRVRHSAGIDFKTTESDVYKRQLKSIPALPGIGFDRDWVTDKVTYRLLTKCRPFLVHLNLRGCNHITPASFYSIRECRNLQDLNLSECLALTDDTLKMVAEGCKILLYLNISYTDVTDASFRTIGKCCPNLQYLSIAFCRQFTSKGLAYLSSGKGAKRLVYLDMSGCTQITGEGFKNLADGCTEIQSLVLNDMTTLDNACLQPITDKCKALKHISLLGSPNVTDDAIKGLASGKKLQKMKIEGNQKMTDATFKALGKTCGELRHLYMVDCQQVTDLSLKYLASCNSLTVLNLADCVRMTDTGVKYITDSSCGGKLRELNLTNCIRVGDRSMVNINKRCHSLSYLAVCYCEHISEAGVELLGQIQSLTSLDISGCNCGDLALPTLATNNRLKDLNVSECVSISDLGLQKFAQQCTEIERLDLSHCQLVSDAAIKNLAFCCRMITVLNLAGCKQLTDLSVQYLSGVCHYLVVLDMSGSLHITDKSLRYLRKGCKRLNTLIVYYCRNITKNGVYKMMRYVPEVLYSDEEIPGYYNY